MRKQHQTTYALLRTFYQCQIHNKNSYSWMSIETIRNRLKDGYGISVSYEAVRWQLAKLKAQGLLITFPTKYRRCSNGTIYAITPNRSLTLPGLKWLRKAGLYIYTWLWNHLTGDEKLPRGKGRYANGGPSPDKGGPDQTPEEIRKLIPSIGKSFA